MKAGFIDVGSNSIRFMTGEKTGADYTFSDKQVYTTRLAERLAQTGLLSPARVAQSLATIESLCRACGQARIPVYAYATSAVRDAANRAAVVDPVQALTGGRLSVLSGAEEARCAYLAATGGRGGMIDIGGGSTQVVTSAYTESFPLGCVRAKDLCAENEFPAIQAALRPVLDRVFQLPSLGESVWTGIGGTVTTLCACRLGLAAYDSATVQDVRLTRDEIESTLLRLSRLGENRQREPLLTKRHDVILPGGAILLYVLDRVGATSLRVSDRDGLEGFAMKILNQEI